MIKYMVHPGFVKSRTDGDIHWISGIELTHLYGLNPKETEICGPGRGLTSTPDSVQHFYPRYDGKYHRVEA